MLQLFKAIYVEGLKKFRSEQNFNPDLCDASEVLYQLSYQANWELVIMWIDDNNCTNIFYMSII